MSDAFWVFAFIVTILAAAAFFIWKANRNYYKDDARWKKQGKFNRDYNNLTTLLVDAVEERGIDSDEAQNIIRRLIAAQMKYAETHGIESEKTIGTLISLLPPKSR